MIEVRWRSGCDALDCYGTRQRPALEYDTRTGPGGKAERELGFVKRAQAASADLFRLLLAIQVDGDLLDIGFPLPFGPHVGVADTMPKGWGFATYLTFGHDCFSPT